jgi:hypothetical protein
VKGFGFRSATPKALKSCGETVDEPAMPNWHFCESEMRRASDRESNFFCRSRSLAKTAFDKKGQRTFNHNILKLNRMSLVSHNPPVEFSPFHTVLQNGIDRLLEIISPEEFEFIVKGEHLKSTLLEAVLISPIISESLKSDPMIREFHIVSDEIEATTFSVFLELIRNREGWIFLSANEIEFLSICKLLGNESLSLIFLESNSQSSNVSECSESGKIEICEKNIEDCASQFSSYSIDELRNLPKQTLHSLLSSDSLKIESEDFLLERLIDLGSDYFEYWNYIEISFLSSEGISQFVKVFPFEELRSSHWEKIIDRLIGNCDEKFRFHRFCKEHNSTESIFESMILSTIPIPLKQFETRKWNLLYRGSRDGFRGSDFHEKCDDQSNTVTVILTTKGFIFGGFAPISWDSSDLYKADNSQQSFLFSVKNARNSDPRSFPLTNSSKAIYCGSSYGPRFGNGSDILVADGCNQNTNSYTCLGYSYRNNTGLNGNQVFTGEQCFQVKEIEVFSITL